MFFFSECLLLNVDAWRPFIFLGEVYTGYYNILLLYVPSGQYEAQPNEFFFIIAISIVIIFLFFGRGGTGCNFKYLWTLK